MLMEAGMALEPCQYDRPPDDEPRRGSLLSESDSDMEDTKGSTSATEPNELPPIGRDIGESRAAPHRAPRLGELSTDATMDGIEQEFFDAPDHFMESTNDGGKAAPTIESNDMTALVNTSRPYDGSNSCDGKSTECGKSEDEPQNSIHCKDFIENPQSPELSGQRQSTTERKEITEQHYSIAETENDQPHTTTEPEDISDHHNTTEPAEMSDHAHGASQPKNNSDQLHPTREFKEICHQVQSAMGSETVHQPRYVTDSTDGSEKPNDRVECEEVCDHSDEPSNTTLLEGILDQHKTTEAKDLSNQRDSKTEPEVTCGQQVDLKETKIISNQCKKNAEPETIDESIKIMASEEICYRAQNTNDTANLSGNPHSNAEHKEGRAEPENNREFEEINEQAHSAAESKDTSCHLRGGTTEPEEITEQINTTRGPEAVQGPLHNTVKCEVIDQLNNMTKSENVSTELCNNTNRDQINDLPQSTVVSEEIGGQPQNQAHCSDLLHSIAECVETSNRLRSTAESVDIVDQSRSATEAKETVDQSSNIPDSENSSNQTYKAKGRTENNDSQQDSVNVVDHNNPPPISKVSAEHSEQLNSTYPIERTADLSIAVKNKDLKEVSDKSELGESFQRPHSNVQNSKIEAMCQNDGLTTRTLNDLPQNVNIESSGIPQTCIDSQQDIGHEDREPIASAMSHPQDIVFTDTHIVNEDDSKHCFNDGAIQAAEGKLPIEGTSLESNVTKPSDTTTQSHQSDISSVYNDGSSSNLMFPEAHDELQNAIEPAESSQRNSTDKDHQSTIGIQPFVTDATTPFVEATHLLDFISLPCSDVEAMERDDPGLEVGGQLVSHMDSNIINVYDTSPAGMDIHECLLTEDVDVQEIRGLLSEQELLTLNTASGAGRTDFLEHDSRISLNEESESAVVHPSSSNESLDVCPQSSVSHKQSLDEDQIMHSSVVEPQTVVRIVDQTQNRDPSPQIPNPSFLSGQNGQKLPPCEMIKEIAEVQEPITEAHESQNKPQRPISMTFEPHSESLLTANFDGSLHPDSEVVPTEVAIPEQEIIDQKSDEAKNDELAWNVPEGQQGNLCRENSELEPKPHRLVHQTSSTEGRQAPFYVTEEWKEALQPPNQRVYFRLKQEVGIDRALSVDSSEMFPLPPEANSESMQLDPPCHDLNVLVEPQCEEVQEDAQETDGVAVEVNPFRINTDFMKFLGHVPKYFGEAVEELGELQPRSSQGLDEVDGGTFQTSDISSSTSAGHEIQQDTSVWDSTVNIEGINTPLTGKQTTPIHFFNPLLELELSPEETEAFFKSDIVAHLQDDSTLFVTPATPPANHFGTSLPTHTSISHTASANEYDLSSDTKERSTLLQVADISPMPEFSPNSENVFDSPQPSPVTVIAGTAEPESESRSSWLPTWKVPDDSVMQLLSKKLISPKLSRSGSKIYRTSGGVAAMNKDTQSRHSTPVLISHSPLEDQRVLGVTESREPNRARTKTPKPFHIALAPAKPLFRQVALPEVSEEAPRSAHEDPRQVGKIKSGRLRMRDEFEQHTSSSTEAGALNRPTVQIFISEGEFAQDKPRTCPVKTQNESERTSNLAAVNSRSQEDLTSGSDKSQDWRRKGVRKGVMAVSQDDEPPDEDMDLTASDPVHLRAKNFANQTSNFIRRRSKLIDSSRLLYQEYSDVALNQAIERQKRTETFLEDSEPSSPRLRRKLMSSPDSYLQRLSVSSSASLWQDIPMIRGTSTLLSMTREEQKLQEAKFELIMSEASYLRSLNIAVDHFQHSPELQTLLSNQERQWLFSRLQEVRDVSADLLFDLEEKFEDNMYTFNVCDVVLSHAPAIRKVYLPYVTNQSYQDQTFRQLLSGNPRFQQVLEKLESDAVCQRLSLKSFLILPFQRITRLKLLVQNILKRTRLGSREEAQATQAYNLMEKLIRDCNENVQRMRSTEELIYLSQKTEFECKIFPLISQSRRLVKQGELVELEYSSPLSFKWKVITRPVYLHLFNDCLLLSRRREGARFVVFDHARASKVRGEKCEIKLHGTNKNIFRLTLLENNQGRRVEFLLRTDTQSEKLRWISALAPPRKKPDLMECHDNPQVQCLKSYKARENDELSLEKADVVMVMQQSKDGWIEGTRLSDGEHGWFPIENVEDISNRHVRLRNLKEEHRVQCARAKLMPLHNRR